MDLIWMVDATELRCSRREAWPWKFGGCRDTSYSYLPCLLLVRPDAIGSWI